MTALARREPPRASARAATHGLPARGESGASIIIALFFVMVCTVVAAIVMTFSVVNAERTAQHAQEEMAYYSVVSALDEVKGTMTYVKASAVGYNVDTGCPDQALGKIMGSWAETAIAGGGSTSEDMVVTVEGSGKSGDDDVTMSTVQLSFKMTGHNITVTVRQVGDDPVDRDYNYPLVLTFRGSATSDGTYSWTASTSS